MNKFFGHLKTVMTHRFWVRHYCFMAGLVRQGFTHDLSKYHPVEFFESVKYYQGTRSPIDACKEENGHSKAWLHHRSHNKHHREYWTDYYDKGTYSILVPYKYAVEMLCDFLGAGRAYMGKNFSYVAERLWWINQLKKGIKIHPHTAHFITTVLNELCKVGPEGITAPDIIFSRIDDYYYDSYEWLDETATRGHRMYDYYDDNLNYKENSLTFIKELGL